MAPVLMAVTVSS